MPLENFLPFSKPSINQDAIDEVVASLESGWITTGPKVKRFEEMLKTYLHAPFVLPLSSATAGLHLALLALDLQPGDEVITTPMTFAATLNTIELAGGTVKLVDVEKETYNIDTSLLEAAITDKTRAIIPVHFAGAPVDLDPIYTLAERHNFHVIEDAAHSIGTEYKGKKIGAFGHTQVFSFHPNKNITTGEGGAVATTDEKLAEKVALLRFHGMDREAWNRFGKSGSQHYEILYPGFKYNMLDIQAAIGLHQIPYLDEYIEKRTALVARYQEALSDWPALTLPGTPNYDHKHAWHLFAPLVNSEFTDLDRDEFMAQMKAHNVGTGLHYIAAHLYPYYRDKYGFKPGDFPNAKYISDRIVSLPLFPNLTFDEQDQVIDIIKNITKGK